MKSQRSSAVSKLKVSEAGLETDTLPSSSADSYKVKEVNRNISSTGEVEKINLDEYSSQEDDRSSSGGLVVVKVSCLLSCFYLLVLLRMLGWLCRLWIITKSNVWK